MSLTARWGLVALLTFSCSAITTASFAADKTVTIQGDLKSYEYTLPNGMTVVLAPNPRAPTTSVYHWVKVGSAHEAPGTTGIAHLFEHMMFRPLDKSGPNFDDKIRPLGGHANANTRLGATVYTTTVANGNLEQLLTIESERFKKLKVDEELLNTEREAVRSEYSTKLDSLPTMDLWFALFRQGFPNHPFGWTVVGYREDLDKITAKDCNSFFAKYYKPNNIGLFIAGDFDLEKARKWIETSYGGWEKGEVAKLPPVYENKAGFVRAEGKLPAKAKNLVLAYRLGEMDANTYPVAEFAEYVLSNPQNSLAQRKLIFEKKIATNVSGFMSGYDWGTSEFMVVLKPDQTVDTAIDAFTALADDVEKLSDAEFQAYLNNYQIANAEAIQRNESLNDSLSYAWGKWGSIENFARTVQEPMKISKADLSSYVKKLLRKDNLIAVTNKQAKG